MRIYSISLLFLMTAIAAIEPQSSNGSLRIKLSTTTDQTLANVPVQIWLEPLDSINKVRRISLVTDRSSSLLIEHLPAAAYRLRLEPKGFDDYLVNEINIQAGENTTIEGTVEPVEELPIVRLSDDQVLKFVVACQESASSKTGTDRITFEDTRKWAELWSQFKLPPPDVDFKKWRVLASIRRSNQTGAAERIRRITYNPERKVTRIRFDSPPQPLIRQPAFSCDAEFVLIPPRAGELAFSFTTGQSVQR
jgi:hypothetical protein